MKQNIYWFIFSIILLLSIWSPADAAVVLVAVVPVAVVVVVGDDCVGYIAVSFHPMLLDAGNNHLAAHSAQTPAKQDIPFPGISGGTSEEAVFALTKPDKKLYSILSNANIYY